MIDDNKYHILKHYDEFFLTHKELDNDDENPYEIYTDVNNNNKMIYVTSPFFKADENVYIYPMNRGLKIDDAKLVYNEIMTSIDPQKAFDALLNAEKIALVSEKRSLRKELRI